MREPAILSEVSGETSRACEERGKALLFRQLAQFLVWGQQNPDVGVRHPDFDRLLRNAADILEGAGIRENPAAESQVAGLDELLA